MKFFLSCYLLFFVVTNATQITTDTYYISWKGIYVELNAKGKRTKVLYKENESFYFSLKNDSIAIVQEIYKDKFKDIEEHRISPNYDTVYIKRYSSGNNKRKVNVERVFFRKVY